MKRLIGFIAMFVLVLKLHAVQYAPPVQPGPAYASTVGSPPTQPGPEALGVYWPEKQKRLHDARGLLYDVQRRADRSIRYAQRAVTLQELITSNVTLTQAMGLANDKTEMIVRGGDPRLIEQLNAVKKAVAEQYAILMPRLEKANTFTPTMYP